MSRKKKKTSKKPKQFREKPIKVSAWKRVILLLSAMPFIAYPCYSFYQTEGMPVPILIGFTFALLLGIYLAYLSAFCNKHLAKSESALEGIDRNLLTMIIYVLLD